MDRVKIGRNFESLRARAIILVSKYPKDPKKVKDILTDEILNDPDSIIALLFWLNRDPISGLVSHATRSLERLEKTKARIQKKQKRKVKSK